MAFHMQPNLVWGYFRGVSETSDTPMPPTENQAKNAKPLERAYKLADSEGLFLLVQPNGAKLWRMKYRFAGKEKLLSFGAYPGARSGLGGIGCAQQPRNVLQLC
jgi:hypothetical protein